MITITINGLPTSTKADRSAALPSWSPTISRFSSAPSCRKKKSSRKSRSGTSRLPIDSRKGVDPSETPATNAPTSWLNPRDAPALARIIAHATANRISSSCDCASQWTSRGSTQCIRIAIAPRNAAPLTRITRLCISRPRPDSSPPNAESTISARIATTSCTIRKPTATRPCRESISRLSESSFTMMIVLENVSATATYTAATGDWPSSSRQIRNPITEVKMTCPSPVAAATGPSVRIVRTSRRMPTRNRRIAIPIRASRSRRSPCWRSPSPHGPTITPTMMNVTTTGCRSSLPTAPAAAANVSRAARL